MILAQELSESQINRIRNIQEHLVANPKKAYAEDLEISTCKNELFRFYGRYYVANYFYNQSDFIHSKNLLILLIESIEKSEMDKSSKVYQDLIGMCVNKLFYIHKNLGAYDKALFYLDKYKTSLPHNHFNEQYGSIKVAMGDYVNGIALLKRELKTSHHLKLGVGEKKVVKSNYLCNR